MSKANYNNVFGLIPTNKDKLMNLLLTEIIFMKNCSMKTKSENERLLLNFALKKFEFLSNLLYNHRIDISNKDYEKFLTIIYRTIENLYQLM